MTITLFSTTGDPNGIRHVDKFNWSGFGVVFSKDPTPLATLFFSTCTIDAVGRVSAKRRSPDSVAIELSGYAYG